MTEHNDGPTPPTHGEELEGCLYILAGKVAGIEEVLRMIYEGSSEPDSNNALLLRLNVASEVRVELRELAEEVS